jgi:hypothetical protein
LHALQTSLRTGRIKHNSALAMLLSPSTAYSSFSSISYKMFHCHQTDWSGLSFRFT